jgi:S1-C subfamily serine protease
MKTKKIGLVFLIFLAVIFVSTCTTYLVLKQHIQNIKTDEIALPTRFTNNNTDTQKAIQTDFTYAAERSIHSVVHVKTKYKRTTSNYSNGSSIFDFFFGQPEFRMPEQQIQEQMSSGSGVIVTTDGYIVTNNHVIENASEIEITLNDKRTFNAEIVGIDASTDIALLKIEADSLPTLSLGNSDLLKVGEWVLAVGNPFNLTSTVTAGIVSAKARNINILNSEMKIESFIQILFLFNTFTTVSLPLTYKTFFSSTPNLSKKQLKNVSFTLVSIYFL